MIRLIDYDFSGMNDPMFDVGDLAMEGDYYPDQLPELSARLLRRARARAGRAGRLFGIGAQYTWSLLFVGMDELLSDSPDEHLRLLGGGGRPLGLDPAQARGPGARES